MSKKHSKKHDDDATENEVRAEDFALLHAALGYVREGFPVFPLAPGSKIPFARSKGLLDATLDEDLVKVWWTESPQANIGIPTGKASGLFVLDVDMGYNKRGEKSLKKLVAKNGELPPTRLAETPHGGLHFLYRYPEDSSAEWRNSASTLAPDVDVRAEGGYIAVWPSRLSDGAYSWNNPGAQIARLPKWLAKKARYQAPVIETKLRLDAKNIPDELRPRLETWTTSAIDGEVQRLSKMQALSVPRGETYKGEPWDNTTYQVACRLVEIAVQDWAPVSVDDVRDLFVANAPRDAQFTKKEHARIWASAVTKTGTKTLPLPVEVESFFLIPFTPKGAGGEANQFPNLSPDSYFEKAEGLLAERAACAINYDLARGTDGRLWSYAASGVWEADKDVIARRLGHLLRDRYRRAHAGTIEDLVLGSGLPKLSGDPHEAFINTRSGMYEWKTGKIVDHSPTFLSTVQLPIVIEEGAKCPKFDAFVARALPADSAKLIWEVLGYMLLNGNPLQKAVLLHGDGGNGKGVILRMIQAMAGKYNTSSVDLRSIAEGKFEVASLFGKLANVAGDIDARYLRDSARFKSLTGQDTVSAQFKYKDEFHFTCWATPIFSANELWRSADTSEGYFRRWTVVPFPNKLEGTDAKFKESDLHAEIPGVFLKAMEALRELMERGKFELGLSAMMLQDDFVGQSDTVQVWLEEDDDIKGNAPGTAEEVTWLKRADLYNAFRSWGIHSGQPVISSTKFYRRLRALHFIETRRNGMAGFYGISLHRLHTGVADVPMDYGEPRFESAEDDAA